MISSSEVPNERGLDTMLIVYSLLEKHPASLVSEQFIRDHAGWFTTPLALFEAKAILTKIYGIEGTLASHKLAQFAAGPIQIIELDAPTTLSAMNAADTLGIDLTDAVLLQIVQSQGASLLATEDSKLTRVCVSLSIQTESPIDEDLRRAITAWEATNLAEKGLPRILRRIHQWLGQTYPDAAENFWSQTGAGSHLP